MGKMESYCNGSETKRADEKSITWVMLVNRPTYTWGLHN